MVIVVVMGVCGSGKTTVGKALSEMDRLPWLRSIQKFIQSRQEICQTAVVTCSALKRSYREILTAREPRTAQAYRQPDTSKAHRHPDIAQAHGQPNTAKPHGLPYMVQADKHQYTAQANRQPDTGQAGVIFVFLKGSESLLRERMSGRDGHFMPSELLTSQLQTLEEPCSDEKHVVADISQDVESLVKEIYTYITSLND
ncbi:probable gluconokinase isoform X2 [Liolophura sinensis]|uniref:probable gluconokinase isoform X2 n=1 Tax=Liolophura sinensis TaxID=3198878 RepID=UPI003158E8B7